MSYLRTDRIVSRLREICEDGLAQYRTIASGTYGGDLPDGLSIYGDQRRALVVPSIRISIPGLFRAAESPPTNGSLLIYDLGIEIRLIRLIERGAQVTPDDYSAIQALAAMDADILRQGIEYSRNTRFTSDALPTGLIGVWWTQSKVVVRGVVDDGAQTMETIHSFSAKAVTTPEVDTSIEVENPQDNPDIGVSVDTEIEV
jgi:hypothetical protein